MSKKITFICNDKTVSTEAMPALTVLDFLRKELSLTGTKEGCREGDCGACTVLVGTLVNGEVKYKNINSCLLPIEAINGKHLVTIEGTNRKDVLNTLQNFMVEEGATQCGFCTPGFLISFTGYFLDGKPKQYDINELVNYLEGNICRCTGHSSIIRAAEKSVVYFNTLSENEAKALLLPEYSKEIPARLKKLNAELVKTNGKSKKAPYMISGGTDLYVQKWEDIYNEGMQLYPGTLEKKKIKTADGKIFISAETTVSEIMNSDIMNRHFPEIKEYFKLFGSTPIRNRATAAGNIVNASPIADMTSFFLANNASVILSNGKKERTVLLKNLYLGYKTLDKKKDEVITSVFFNIPSKNSLFSFEKVSRRTYLDIASVNTSMYIETKNDIVKEVHISAGGVFAYPLYLSKTREFLLGKKVNDETVAEAARIALQETSPISDARGSADYKKLLLRQLFFAHFIKLFPMTVKFGELV